MCTHLVAEHPPGSYRILTGAGMDYHLQCAPCVDAEAPLIEVCEGCADNAGQWDSVLGWLGEPEIKHRDREPGGTWLTWDSPVRPVNDRCLAPLPGNGWLALTADGLVEIDDVGEHRPRGPVDLPDEPPNEWNGRVRGPALHASADGTLVAVVTDYGRYGTVLERESGKVVLALDRQDYHTETTPFPFAFTGEGMITATDWNRLDAFDATGRLLTDRETGFGDAKNPREHYLDFFHGALTASPSGRLLVSDGWVWHPVGIPIALDVGAWLAGDRHAAEHGVELTLRQYAWDQPIAWIGEDTVAVQRIGHDDEQMIDGVELFDAVSGHSKGMFAGPSGPMWAHDGLLYVAAEAGFEIWDPAEGARIGLIEGFAPTAHDPSKRTFAELGNGQLRIWTSTR